MQQTMEWKKQSVTDAQPPSKPAEFVGAHVGWEGGDLYLHTMYRKFVHKKSSQNKISAATNATVVYEESTTVTFQFLLRLI